MYTIGHSTHSIESFVGLLQAHSVNCVCDVRSAPYSRRNPQFNRENLRASLKRNAIRYVFLGKELGARAEQKDCYVDGKVSFALLAASPLFKAGIARLLEGNTRFTIALMCAEKEPLNCHRTVLVARQLEAEGIAIEHILANGDIEKHQDTIDRLIALLDLDRTDLFADEAEIIDRAYRLREDAVAFEDRS